MAIIIDILGALDEFPLFISSMDTSPHLCDGTSWDMTGFI